MRRERRENVAIHSELVVLRATDPPRLCRFYRALGLHFVTEKHGAGPVHHVCELGEVVLEIYPRGVDEPSTAGTRLGFIISSLDQALAALKRASCSIVSEPQRMKSGRRAVVCDPEGHRVELVELVERLEVRHSTAPVLATDVQRATPKYRAIAGREVFDEPLEWRVEDESGKLICTVFDAVTAARIAAALTFAESATSGAGSEVLAEALGRFRSVSQ